MKRRGFYANGRQRWFCHTCQQSFHWDNRHAKRGRKKIWFERWIIEGYSVRQLCQHSGHSRDKLYQIINYWLARSPDPDHRSLGGYAYVIFDGTFLHRPVSIIVLMDGATNRVISGKYGVSENSTTDLAAFFESLTVRALSPESCTTNGNPQVIKMVRRLWPGIIIQRCLVHVQRQGLMWCRRYPRRVDATMLRDIFRQVTTIRTIDERNEFVTSVGQWEEKYGRYIATQPERGRVFSDIKRARSMLLKALPDMFHYLDNPNIPATTNSLEGYFSRLKDHYRCHRGLKPEKRSNYFDWYFRLCPT